MNAKQAAIALLMPVTVWTTAALGGDPAAEKRVVERGRYLATVGGCNDCHTPRYPETGGQVPVTEWLTGNPVGFQGPWGTTYPANLRLLTQTMTEAQWVERARTAMRPPMPWFNLRDMTDQDLRAMYQFIRGLGAKGEPAPAYVPPGEVVSTPYFNFVPQNLPQTQAVTKAH